MLLRREDSCLVLVDVQEKLTPHVLNSENLITRCDWLLRLAQELDVPTVISEQYPQGLGLTVEPLRNFGAAFHKIHFSCYRVLIGIEAHVCVMQTALDLCEAGYDVFVVVDAVSSRHEADYHYGLKRIKQSGGWLVTAEMVFFEWVEKAGSAEFKALSKAYLQG